jgi:hypothetical protein
MPIRSIVLAGLLLAISNAIGCSKHIEGPAVAEVPTETPAQFQARRDAEVARIVAENHAKREADEAAEAEAEKQRNQSKSAALLAKLEQSVCDHLKDPDSAQFSNIQLTPSGNALCGNVNARNGFGGYTGAKAFVATEKYVLINSDDISTLFAAASNAEGCP